ncbi:glycoside hydrolase [Mangrovimonas yunxiaonensis]|uniref:Glycoside hydrolase n=1 Tax=Mangrovimonas yunxiaonensis TaxID=1197477 RepID=A0A084TLP8_9FLAO|nr:C40 family peptidase [Mangrovimonas yunxiaonensis]KFB01634.1 glycoside hydrolase [Mangrovimonas yunxiaonensis]GGH35536.1 hypothetical protein GCM10011364_02140 [Mangrovimonas yunxiaonensis]
MKKQILILTLILLFSSCKSTKGTKVVTKRSDRPTPTTPQVATTPEKTAAIPAAPYNSKTVNSIISEAQTYNGVKYKYGGDTKRGIDCSGLITTAFKRENILLPRSTSSLSSHGDWIALKEVQKGDLLFFATKKNSRQINHVGLVTASRPGHVEFIHSTTSRGVITSKLSEKYWYFAFVQARRVL